MAHTHRLTGFESKMDMEALYIFCVNGLGVAVFVLVVFYHYVTVERVEE